LPPKEPTLNLAEADWFVLTFADEGTMRVGTGHSDGMDPVRVLLAIEDIRDRTIRAEKQSEGIPDFGPRYILLVAHPKGGPIVHAATHGCSARQVRAAMILLRIQAEEQLRHSLFAAQAAQPPPPEIVVARGNVRDLVRQ